MGNKTDHKNQILVVDDEQMNLKAIKRLLRKDGYKIKYAQSGAEALEIAEDFIPDLVILDIMMPGIDGYETCKRLKAGKKTSNAMVLLLSGKKSVDDRLKGYEVDADDFISKPYDPDELKAKIRILLRLKNTRQELLLEIAEKKAAEALLIQTNKDLETAVARAEKLAREADQANQVKSRFLAGMSHELNTPLNGVLGLTQVLLESGIDGKQKEYVLSLEKSGSALLFALDGILDYSKLEAGELLLETETFNPGQVVEAVGDAFKAELDAKQIGLSIDIKPESNLEKLTGDKNRFTQVLRNLVSNAVKFTEAGSVSILLEAKKIDNRSTRIRVSVSDTGIGIPDTLQSRIFEPFSRVDDSLSRKTGGVGIGLSVSRKIALLMGGDIIVESETEKGSRFVFACLMENMAAVDSKDEKAVETTQKAHDEKGNVQPVRILVVEDNPINQKVAEIMLSKAGHDITMACNGLEAVDIYFKQPESFDMIFMDVQMPEMDGLEATRTIREKGGADIPIVALTAHAMKGDREKCLESGMNDYMTKPFKKEILLEMVRKWGGDVPMPS